MNTRSPQEISSRLLRFAETPRSILFAGSGISARLGVPTWSTLLEKLSEVCVQFEDRPSADLIGARVCDGHLLSAATVYTSCEKIPKGERYRQLAGFLNPADAESQISKLDALMGLGFSGVVTTNYDRVLHNAYAHAKKRAARPLEIDDDSLKGAASLTEFYIARIHGRMEKPETIVFDAASYDRILIHPQYQDFLFSLFTQRPCLFLGFSFLDPAITHILDLYEQKYGPTFPQLHLAVIPNTAAQDLGKRLGDVNIEVLHYDPHKSHHDLWDAIRLANQAKLLAQAAPPRNDEALRQNFSRFKRFAAFSYAQTITRKEHAPLIASAKSAIALSLIEEGGPKAKQDAEYHRSIADLLHIELEAAREIFAQVVAELIATAQVDRKNGRLVLTQKPSRDFDEKLDILAKAVSDRIKVLSGQKLSADDKRGIVPIIEKVFLARAWDLAAFYAGAKVGYPPDLSVTLDAILSDEKASGRAKNLGPVRTAISDMLQRPSDEEAEILSEVGRSAFALQILFSSPRQTQHHRFALPGKIYFDSNFLLPAIVPGHPMRPLYESVIQRLKGAATKNRTPLELVVAYQFVNEIVSHRKLAQETVRRLDLEDPRRLRQHIAQIGAHNGNVFVGAYATAVGRAERKVKFDDFLKRVAPYTNEAQLMSYLKGAGFRTVIQDPAKMPNYERVKTLLTIGYRRGELNMWGLKDRVLVEHEAGQLAALLTEIEQGWHSVFITADLRLANVIYSDNYLKKLSGALMSHLGFVGMVDLLIGARVDAQAFARLVWTSPRTPDESRIRDYLLQRALASYDAALAKRMHEVINETTRVAQIEVDRRGVTLNETRDVEEMKKAHDVLDRMENQFFAKMSEAMDKT